jgi:hypothetical protein
MQAPESHRRGVAVAGDRTRDVRSTIPPRSASRARRWRCALTSQR